MTSVNLRDIMLNKKAFHLYSILEINYRDGKHIIGCQKLVMVIREGVSVTVKE